MKSHKFLGVRVDDVTGDEVMSQITNWVASKTPHQITTVNPEFVMRARHDHAFRRVISQSDLAIPDGMGLVLLGRVTGRSIRQRVTGADLTEQIAAEAAKSGWRLFFLGAQEGIAAEAASRLAARYPKLQVVGTYAGAPTPEEEAAIVAMVKKAAPDILLVAYGAPRQDLWISRHQTALGIPVAMGVGGTFDFIAGVATRAPHWIGRVGLEWLWRLVQEPWRWRRMLVLPKFALLALLEGMGLVRA